MNYPLESLGPEIFQEFAQSLLLHDFPEIRCFPVGQPDGGRDALRMFDGTGSGTKRKSQWVYQVKFVREPEIPDATEWATTILDKESEKIAELKRRGCEKYILVTNANGSSHLGVGTIDKLLKALQNAIEIPVEVLWRHDINRRLDNAWSLKWSYPILMQGPDFLRVLFESGIGGDWERKYDAIKAFLRDQFERDADVRFKQIELKTSLFDLYVDVPVIPASLGNRPGRKSREIEKLVACYDLIRAKKSYKDRPPSDEEIIVDQNGYSRRRDGNQLDAAEFLFSPLAQKLVPALVLEGAPGQGKSTIAQFICQRYRSCFLATANPTPNGAPNGLRLPIKIDLRDYAVWLSKRNPFDKKSDDIPENWEKSVESFISTLVRFHSGGFKFSVDDLVSISKRSSLLVVFDGLDEVADINIREQIVSEISRGYSRLLQNSASVQFIVTSRPAAFINAPVLPEEHFEKLILAPLSTEHIHNYVKKWQLAKSLNPHDIAQLDSIIEKRLGEPHLKELARNPMQLAILLNLMHTRGVSLPDKRTALYDSYVDLFFDREAEKSEIVREFRELLVNIHRYLAWKIHINSESGDATGRVSEPEMKQWIRSYLDEEGHNPTLLDRLFQGMVERVVAIVSRVEGTYEFEVQPLREYFTARFLYETAPYSPPGREQSGTKPDRFFAVAKNFYWLNVARFLAGCFSKGELLALIEKLEELSADSEYKLISHPRMLAFTLLSDWVFSQHPRSVGRVVELVTTDYSFRFLGIAGGLNPGRRDGLTLPDRCGRNEFASKAIALLDSRQPNEFAWELVAFLRNNASQSDLKAKWCSMRLRDSDFAHWVEIGFRLGTLGGCTSEELSDLFLDHVISDQILLRLLFARQFEFLQRSTKPSNLINAIMDREMFDRGFSRITSFYELLCTFTDLGIFININMGYYGGFDPNLNREFLKAVDNQNTFKTTGDKEIDSAILSLASIVAERANRGGVSWRSSLEHWNPIVNALSIITPNSWIERAVANLAAGIRSKTELGAGGEAVYDTLVPRTLRYRFARLRAGQGSWWKTAIEQAQTKDDSYDILLLFYSWASTSVVKEVIKETESLLRDLQVDEYRQLFEAVRASWIGEGRRENLDPAFLRSLKSISLRAWYLLGPRTAGSARTAFVERSVDDWSALGTSCCQFAHNIALSMIHQAENEDAIAMLVSCFRGGASSSEDRHYGRYYAKHIVGLPLDRAKNILETPLDYPFGILAIAEERAREAIAKELTPIGKVADSDNWFPPAEE